MSLVIALSATPGLLGTQEAVRQAQRKESREEHRARRCNFIAHCIKSSLRAREINDRPLVLRDGRIFIDSGVGNENEGTTNCAGYYLPYPDSPHEGLVTRISSVLPIMNWVYIDAATHQLCYGVRKDAEGNMTGPFDCTSHSRRVTFQGWEGWCAVEEQSGLWAVYFDVEDDALQGKVPPDTRILEIEIERREERWKKGEHASVPVRRNMVQKQSYGSEQEGASPAPERVNTGTPDTLPPLPTIPEVDSTPLASPNPVINQPNITTKADVPFKPSSPSSTEVNTSIHKVVPSPPTSKLTTEESNQSWGKESETETQRRESSGTDGSVSPKTLRRTSKMIPRSNGANALTLPSYTNPKKVRSQQRLFSSPGQIPHSSPRALASREMLRLFNEDERQYVEELSTLFTHSFRPLSLSLSLPFPDGPSPRSSSSDSVIRRAVRRMSTGSTGLFKSLSIRKGSAGKRHTATGAERIANVLHRKRRTF